MSWLRPNHAGQAANGAEPLDTTITYLRMERPPATYPAKPANVHAALLAVPEPPLHFYRYLYFQVGIHWNWEARLRMDDAALRRAVHAEPCEITVLYVDGAPAGFFELNRKSESHTDLAYFGMMPHVHGMGLGRWFLGQAIEAAWSAEPEEVTVNTCTLDHPAALPLYQKMGFRPYRQSQGRVHPLTENERTGLSTRFGITGGP